MEAVLDKVHVESYTSYKNSGVKWLGEIPSHWKTLSNKYVFTLKKNQVGKRSNEYTLLSLTLEGVIKRDMVNPQGKFPAEFNTYQEVKVGDFIFCLFDVEETPRTVGLSPFDGMITGAYTVMEPRSEFDRGFLYYFYLNLDTDKRMKPLYTGLRNTISKENFFSFKTFIPPKEEQTQIAQFLDRKTAQIDQTIAQKEKQIELLKERRQILIHKAVTRGLNPNVKLKDSGVEYLDNIPSHWNLIKFKFIVRTKARLGWKGLKASEYVDKSSYGFLSTPNIKGEDIDFSGAYFISQIRYEESPEIMLQRDDVLLVKDGSTLGIVNLVKDLPFACTVNSSIAVLRITAANLMNASYLKYYLKSDYSQKVIELKKDGMGVPHLFQSDINNFLALMPPIHEQEEIVDHIESGEKKIAKAISLKEKEIEKLKEYKSTLINSAVTGKIKVA